MNKAIKERDIKALKLYINEPFETSSKNARLKIVIESCKLQGLDYYDLQAQHNKI